MPVCWHNRIGLPRADLFGWSLDNPRDWIIPSLVGMLLVYAFCHRLGESAFGRVLKGVREDPLATQALCKNVFAYKLQALMLGGVFGALGGVVYALPSSVNPGVYVTSLTFFIYTALLLGGAATVFGPVVGAAIMPLEPLPIVPATASQSAALQPLSLADTLSRSVIATIGGPNSSVTR